MTRTFNLQLLRGKWVFPASKSDAIAKLKPRNSLVRILDRHYCSSSVFITCQCAHAHIGDDGTKRKQTKRAHNNETRATRAATPFWWRHHIDSFGYFPDCLRRGDGRFRNKISCKRICVRKKFLHKTIVPEKIHARTSGLEKKFLAICSLCWHSELFAVLANC